MQNKPLYLEAFQGSSSEEDTLKFHYVVHCALDAVEEKGMLALSYAVHGIVPLTQYVRM